MEQALDAMDFPKAFTAARTFAPLPEQGPGPPEGDYYPGEKATFAIRVLFRQNASWQGSVAWVETGRESTFRSALELILLIDSALREVRAD